MSEPLDGFGSQSFDRLFDDLPELEMIQKFSSVSSVASSGRDDDQEEDSSIQDRNPDSQGDHLWEECRLLADVSEVTETLDTEVSVSCNGVASPRVLESDESSTINSYALLRLEDVARPTVQKQRRNARTRRARTDLQLDIAKIRLNSYQRATQSNAAALPPDAVATLERWLIENYDYPYPSLFKRLELAAITGLSRRQVQNWFSNARAKLKIQRKSLV